MTTDMNYVLFTMQFENIQIPKIFEIPLWLENSIEGHFSSNAKKIIFNQNVDIHLKVKIH